MLNKLIKKMEKSLYNYKKIHDFSILIENKKYIIEIHEALSDKLYIKIFDLKNNLIEKKKYKRVNDAVKFIGKYNA